jgi:hypothetical protein
MVADFPIVASPLAVTAQRQLVAMLLLGKAAGLLLLSRRLNQLRRGDARRKRGRQSGASRSEHSNFHGPIPLLPCPDE